MTRLLTALLFLPLSAWASCSGSGLTWSCTAGSTTTQMQTAVNSATNGFTMTLANGSYTGNSLSLDNHQGTIICASVGGCSFTSTGDIITLDFCSGNITTPIRISGFNFTASASTAKIWFYCNSDLTKVRIDNNTFTIGAGEIAILFGELSATGHVYGVIDHNTFSATNNFMGVKNISGGQSWATGLRGTSNNLFIEDNTWTFTSFSDLGTGGVDVWRANGTVVRFNTFTNSRIVNHSYCHGGPANSEVYGNTISAPNSAAPEYRNIHFQGSGEETVFNNVMGINSGGDTLVVQHFRGDSSTATSEGDCNSLSNGTVTGSGVDAAHANDGNRSPSGTYGGYPSWHQPGRDGAATLSPVYSWLNRSPGGTKIDLVINGCGGSPPTCYIPMELVANRDFYNAVSASAQTTSSSPFNGSTGMGYGTLANRPTTCTANAEAADAGHGGVGYWATDQGTWNTSGSGGQGLLYSCTATNTWSLIYTPFCYPFPLDGNGLPNPTGTCAASGTASSVIKGPMVIAGPQRRL